MWHDFKQIFVDGIGLGTKVGPYALHAALAAVAFLLALVLFKSANRALLTVVVLQLANEVWDAIEDLQAGQAIRIDSAFKDTAVTIAVAVLLWAVAHWWSKPRRT